MNVHSGIIHNTPKVETSQRPSNDEWTNKIWNTHTTEYYLVTKKNEIQIHATVRMNLENVIISERRQTQNAKYYKILFI